MPLSLQGQVSSLPLPLDPAAGWQAGLLRLRVLWVEQMQCRLLPRLLQVSQDCGLRMLVAATSLKTCIPKLAIRQLDCHEIAAAHDRFGFAMLLRISMCSTYSGVPPGGKAAGQCSTLCQNLLLTFSLGVRRNIKRFYQDVGPALSTFNSGAASTGFCSNRCTSASC